MTAAARGAGSPHCSACSSSSHTSTSSSTPPPVLSLPTSPPPPCKSSPSILLSLYLHLILSSLSLYLHLHLRFSSSTWLSASTSLLLYMPPFSGSTSMLSASYASDPWLTQIQRLKRTMSGCARGPIVSGCNTAAPFASADPNCIAARVR